MILDFNKPKKIRKTDEHNRMYTSDSGVEGTYVPNMSDDDMLKWKAKHIKGENERVEIRKSFHQPGYMSCQALIVVYKNGMVQMSSNGKIYMDEDDWNNFKQAIEEAKEQFS